MVFSYNTISMLIKAFVYVAYMALVINGLDNGLARTPPMGWMSWERFRCNTDCVAEPDNCISAKLLMQMADRMAEDGYLDAGYEYLSVDDCWMSHQRNSSDGRLMADPIRFPGGIKPVIDYVHSKGVKFGIYGSVARTTCKGYPGNQFYIPLDAETYASWGVDMLKFDCCNFHREDVVEGMETMGFFLNRTGRPIMYACGGCVNLPEWTYSNGVRTCNQVRSSIDITDSWDNVYKVIDYYGTDPQNMSAFAGPGHWNDADELVVGDFGLTLGQQRAQMGMWAIIASPLFMSVDLRNIDPAAKEILLNKQILAINQDPMGIQGKRIFKNSAPQGDVEGWLRPLHPKGNYAVAILNANTYGWLQYVNLTMTQLGLTDSTEYTLTEVFTGKTYGPYGLKDSLSLKMEATTIFLAIAEPTWQKDLNIV